MHHNFQVHKHTLLNDSLRDIVKETCKPFETAKQGDIIALQINVKNHVYSGSTNCFTKNKTSVMHCHNYDAIDDHEKTLYAIACGKIACRKLDTLAISEILKEKYLPESNGAFTMTLFDDIVIISEEESIIALETNFRETSPP